MYFSVGEQSECNEETSRCAVWWSGQEELVSAEYLKQLIDAHDAKLRKEARQKLLKVSWDDDDDGTASKKTQQLSTKTEDPKDRLSKDSAKELIPE